jgi:hypothetical protein
MFGIHGRFAVRMAVQAGKRTIVGSIGMTVRTSFPFTFMRTTVNGEIFAVVIKRSTLPRSDVVTCLAFFGETGTGMTRVRRGIVVGKMAGNAFFGQTGVGSAGMTAYTFELMATL